MNQDRDMEIIEHAGLEDQDEMDEEDILEVVECDDQFGTIEDDDESMDGINLDAEMDDTNQNEELVMDTSIRCLDHNHEAVFCVATHPLNPQICASGGADDLGHIWNIATGGTILKLEGHKDSVSVVEFSYDGVFLATGSVDATIKIWKATDRQSFSSWEFLLNLEASEEVTLISWHPKLPILLAGFSDGMIYMWQIPTCLMQVFTGHDSMITCATFTPNGQKIISGTDSGILIIWDIKTAKAEHKINLNEGKHSFRKNDQNQSGINSLAINQAGTICIVGGISNGGVCLVNMRLGTVIAVLNEHQAEATVDVASFEPIGLGLPLLISAGTDGLACIHDGTSFKIRNLVDHQDIITTFTVHKETGLLTTGSANRRLVTWDLKTGQQLKVHSGHRDHIHMVKLTVDHKKLVSCGDDGKVLVFEV